MFTAFTVDKKNVKGKMF